MVATALIRLKDCLFFSKKLNKIVMPSLPPSPPHQAPPKSLNMFGQSLLKHVTRATVFMVRLIQLLLFQLKSEALTFKKEKSHRLHESLVTDTDFYRQA